MPDVEGGRRLHRTFHILFSATLLGLALLAVWTLWPSFQQPHEQISVASDLAPRIAFSFIVIMAALAIIYLLTMRRVLNRLNHLAKDAAALQRAEVRSEMPYRQSRDELGVLARAFEALHSQFRDIARRHELAIEEREKRDYETLRAIGHDIRSPIQALLALNPPASRSWPYLDRIATAVQAIFGTDAMPGASRRLSGEAVRIDLSDFLGQLAANATHIGIDAIEYHATDEPAPVEVDDAALSDALFQILNNADRLRYPGGAIRIFLAVTAGSALITVANESPAMMPEQLEEIFQFVAPRGPGSLGSQAQGLFMARELVVKMRGVILASNHTDGLEIQIVLPLTRAVRCG